jgi:hypothetical protein
MLHFLFCYFLHLLPVYPYKHLQVTTLFAGVREYASGAAPVLAGILFLAIIP